MKPAAPLHRSVIALLPTRPAFRAMLAGMLRGFGSRLTTLFALVALSATPALAHHIDSAIATPDCTSSTIALHFTGGELENLPFTVTYSVTALCTDGSVNSFPGSVSGMPIGAIQGQFVGTFDVTVTQSVPLLAGRSCSITGTATLVNGNTVNVTNITGSSQFQVDCTETCMGNPHPTCMPAGGTLPNGNVCRADCTFCGDGIVNDGEQCDDGNSIDSDSCTNQCISRSTKSALIGPSSMEGAIKISNGDWVNGGYSLKSNVKTDLTVMGQVTITGKCSNGGTDTVIVPLATMTFHNPAGAKDWLPTGDANSVLSWQGSVKVGVTSPAICGGVGKLDASKGAVFTATMFATPPQPGALVTFRFKYRDPAAKGKPNTNCLDTSDPNRSKADVCGASWSETKTFDP